MSIQLRGRIDNSKAVLANQGFVKIDWPVLKLFGKAEKTGLENKIPEKKTGQKKMRADFKNTSDVGPYTNNAYESEATESLMNATGDEADAEELQQQHEDEFINLCINRSI